MVKILTILLFPCFVFGQANRFSGIGRNGYCVTANLFTKSESFSDAVWSATGVTITVNNMASPTFQMSGDQMIEAATTSLHRVFQQQSGLGTGQFSASVFAKAGTRTLLWIDLTDNSTGDAVGFFDLSAGTYTAGSFPAGTITGISYGIENFGNGWYRCWVTATTASGAFPAMLIGISSGIPTLNYLGNTGNYLYLWGGQLNTGTIKCYKSTP